MVKDKIEIRFSGSGGQGLITAGIVAAKAAMLDGKKVTQTQSYGPEARGGASKADVVISNKSINYPEATNLDYLLALTQEASDKYTYDMKIEGTLVVDSSFVKNISLMNSNIYEVPFTDIAIEKLGTKLPTNILSLGFMAKVSGFVSKKSLIASVKDHFKPKIVDLNVKAVELGYKLAEEYNKG